MNIKNMKTCLTIAGSDCSGGAGIQADIKTMCCLGVYGMSAITAMTAQNTTGVEAIQESTPDFLAKQLDCVFRDIFPDAVKTGMIPTAELVEVTAGKLKQYEARRIVVDPVMASTSGSTLTDNEAVETAKEKLLPLADLITPNISEAEKLTGITIATREDMEEAARTLSEKYNCAVLCKGGHLREEATDLLYRNGRSVWYEQKRVENSNTHGTGCTLSSAAASCMARGEPLEHAVRKAKQYVTDLLKAGLDLGHGSGPLAHNFKYFSER